MPTTAYEKRRGQLHTYFDQTAVAAWERLTTDAPVGHIRQTVRDGRNLMRDTLLGWLPPDLSGMRLLDAGCGTGALTVEAVRRGAKVVAVDLSPTLVELARTRLPADISPDLVDFRSGDMLDASLGEFDYIVAMDSLIHYSTEDVVATLASLSARARKAMLFTFAPRTPLLMLMHGIGRFFPSAQRAPSIVPVSEAVLRVQLQQTAALAQWQVGCTRRIDSAFYKSQAMELHRS
ncbi:MAG: magnesium protoporphyrin IX methyltransferase [Pseudohongiellaceae bacterium]